MKSFVIVVDMQRDFVALDGALPVAGAERLIDPMQAWLATLDPAQVAGVLFTADTHLPEIYAGSQEATEFPLHCERGTPGWESAGYQVQGLALSGIAAENLESGSGIASRTIASLEHQWEQGREQLTHDHVLVIDEAGMIGSRQMERVIAEAEKRGAKVVLVGDPEQLQAIEAGAAFRSIAERQGSVEITDIRRQRGEWQRDATRHLATGRTAEALDAYRRAGLVVESETRAGAREALIDRWDSDRTSDPARSSIILTHTREECDELNGLARVRMKQHGTLATDIAVKTSRGERLFAAEDASCSFATNANWA